MATFKDSHDVIIVGGGVGGAALACVLAGGGMDVLLLERSGRYEDLLRGEIMVKWGVEETRRLDLYDVLMTAGYHPRLPVHYDEVRDPAEVRARARPVGDAYGNGPAPICIGHPAHCQTLFDEAIRRGATCLRGVTVTEVRTGSAPGVSFRLPDGTQADASCRIVVGAEGRVSQVREAAGLKLHQDRPVNMVAGMLVGDAARWPREEFTIGTAGDIHYLIFPQDEALLRIYAFWSLDQRQRFSGPDGAAEMLAAFDLDCLPGGGIIRDGTPVGTVRKYLNNTSLADHVAAPGVVLIGDAGGWTDPILGCGLGSTYRDVRMVSEVLLSGQSWSAGDFADYERERAERLRRLLFVSHVHNCVYMEFGARGRARRKAWLEAVPGDPSLLDWAMARQSGPELFGPETFTAEALARIERLGAA